MTDKRALGKALHKCLHIGGAGNILLSGSFFMEQKVVFAYRLHGSEAEAFPAGVTCT